MWKVPSAWHEWGRILDRDVKWKMAYSTGLKEKGQERGMAIPSHTLFEEQIARELPKELTSVEFRVDMAPLDPRPDPKDRRGNPLYVYDPGTKQVSTEPLEEFLDLLPTPSRAVQNLQPRTTATTQPSPAPPPPC